MGKGRVKRTPEVLRQIRQLRRKIRERRTLPQNDRYAHGKNQTQTHLSKFTEKRLNHERTKNTTHR